MSSSLVAGIPRAFFSLLRLDYLIICQGDPCAAKLLALFEAWTASRIDAIEQARYHNQAAVKEGEEPTQDLGRWLYNSVANLKVRLLGEHGDKAITAALKLLEDLGFLLSRFNPKYKWDRTKQYLLQVKPIQEAIYSITEEQILAYIPEPSAETIGFIDSAKMRNGQSENAESINQECGINKSGMRNDPKSHSNSHSKSQLNNIEREPEKKEEEPKPKVAEPPVDIPISATTKEPNPDQPINSSEGKSSAAAVAVRNYNAADPFFKRRPKPNEHYQGVLPLEKWEVAPGEPYPYFWQWREAQIRQQGGGIAANAKSNSYSEFYNNRARGNVLWQEFLEFYKITLDNALQIQATGMTPTLPSCFSNDAPVTQEQISNQLKALGNNVLVALPQAAATPSCQAGKPWHASSPEELFPRRHAQLTNAENAEQTTEPQLPSPDSQLPPPSSPPPEFWKSLAEKLAMPKAKNLSAEEEYSSLIQKYRSWLKSGEPSLKKEAQAKIMSRDDLLPVYDEEGNVIDIEEVDF